MSIAIRFDGVSKKFILHHDRPRAFQETVINFFRRENGSREEFWAVRNVSFQVEQGESVGIIGPNGAGKSTLLKLATRILEPTMGHVEVRGRLSALLELGAGFHSDLTGRENIYLNASVLGVPRPEIRRRFDDIVDFADLGHFIDMPVKHYSSGMQVRLGFAIATTIDPEILIVDEVLAVGDSAFQRRCFDRIDQLRDQGVTILFVSHSAEMVHSVCSRAFWLENGELLADGTSTSVVARYLNRTWQSEEGTLTPSDDSEQRRWGSGDAQIAKVRLLDKKGHEKQLFCIGEPLTVEIHFQTEHKIERPVFGLAIHRADGTHITGPNTQIAGHKIPWIEGRGTVRYTVPEIPLLEGTYYVTVAIHNWEDTKMYDYHDRLYPFRVLPATVGEQYGLVTLKGNWSWGGQRDNDTS